MGRIVRKLHIGGKVKAVGWEILNANPAECVDHVYNAKVLSQFSDNTFEEIYASHVVEHFDYTGELQNALKEWNRFLEPGGKVYISVPELDILAQLILEKEYLTEEERFSVMCMIFGGHVDKYDYHCVGLNEEFLTGFLLYTDYTNIRRVENFGFFKDTSSMTLKGIPISLNMVAEKKLTSTKIPVELS